VFSLVFITNSYAQTIDTSQTLKKGFYKSYEEFIANSPSITYPFQVFFIKKGKMDSTIIAAEYKLEDTLKKVGKVWGFCDGNSVFVAYSSKGIGKKYWKLESTGKYPFFTYAYRSSFSLPMGGLIELATSLASTIIASNEFDLMIINDKGKLQTPTEDVIKKLLLGYPELSQSFKKEMSKFPEVDGAGLDYESGIDYHYEEKLVIIKSYLIKLNAANKFKK
jgi:hypothetical protein